MPKKEKKSLKGRAKRKKESASEIFKKVEFNFYCPHANEVYLAGEFNDWNIGSLPMKKDEEGIWKTEIKLIPGRYEYKFFADGRWIEEIAGVETILNPFGTKNFIISVT